VSTITEYLAFVNRREAESIGIHWSFFIATPGEIDVIKDKYAFPPLALDQEKMRLFEKLRNDASYMPVIVAGN